MSSVAPSILGRRTGDKAVPGELAPDRNNRAEAEAVPCCRGAKQGAEVPETLVGSRERDVGLDLLNFNLDEGRIDILVARMQPSQDLGGFLLVSAGIEPGHDQPGPESQNLPSRRLGEENNKGNVDDRRGRLKQDRGAPRPVGVLSSERNGNARSEYLADYGLLSARSQYDL